MADREELIRRAAEAMRRAFPNPEQDQDEITAYSELAAAALDAVEPLIRAQAVEPVEPILALLHYRGLVDSEQNRADVKAALEHVHSLITPRSSDG